MADRAIIQRTLATFGTIHLRTGLLTCRFACCASSGSSCSDVPCFPAFRLPAVFRPMVPCFPRFPNIWDFVGTQKSPAPTHGDGAVLSLGELSPGGRSPLPAYGRPMHFGSPILQTRLACVPVVGSSGSTSAPYILPVNPVWALGLLVPLLLAVQARLAL